MNGLLRRWMRLQWSDQLASVLALLGLLTFVAFLIVRFIPVDKSAYDSVFLWSAAFLFGAPLVSITFGSGHQRRGVLRWAQWIVVAALLAVELAIFLYYIPAARPLPLLLALAGFLLMLVFLLVWLPYTLILFVRLLVNLTNRVTIIVIASLSVIYFLAFPPFLVFLATNGGSSVSAAFPVLDPRTWTHAGWFRSIELTFLLLPPMLLLVYPAWAHKWLPWKSTSRPTRNFITRVLATGALLSSGIFVFMLHFRGGPLSGVPSGPLAVGILFAVVLLAPYYRSIIRAFWKSTSIDPERSRAVLKNVLKEVQRGRVRAALALERSSAQREEDGTDHGQPADNTPTS